MAEVDVADEASSSSARGCGRPRSTSSPGVRPRLHRRYGALGGEERLEHPPARGGEAHAGARAGPRHLVEVGERHRGVCAARGASRRGRRARACSRAPQRSSIRPKRQTASATAQVATNRPTIDVADGVEVDVGDDVPDAAVRPSRSAEHRQQLDRADQQRDRHRQPGDREVVVDLAHRLGERPAVGEVHERAVDRVEQRHAGGEQDRQAEDRVERQAAARRAAGEHEQRDLGRGVEAQAEQHAERVHVPRPADRARRAAVEARHEPARVRAGAPARASSSSPRRMRRKTRTMPTRIARLSEPDQQQERRPRRAGRRARSPGAASSRRSAPRRSARARRARPASASAKTTSSGRARRRSRRPAGAGPRPSACASCCRSRAMWSASKAWRRPSV